MWVNSTKRRPLVGVAPRSKLWEASIPFRFCWAQGKATNKESRLLYYADGAFVELELEERKSWVYNMSSLGRATVDSKHSQLWTDLLFGVDEEMAQDPRLRELLRRGMVQTKKSAQDPVIEARLDEICSKWLWQQTAPPKKQSKLYRATLAAHAQRKVFVEDFGQTPCLPETAVRRALLAGQKKQRVLCIGDDDLVSIPLALMGHQVVVYDIDDVVLIPFLNRLAKQWGLPLRAHRVDLLQPLARGRLFDAVYSDPMSTQACLQLFLSRGLVRLKRNGRLFCCLHPAAMEVFCRVQAQMGLTVEQHFSGFNHYYDGEFVENDYQSDLFVLRKGKSAKPVYAAHQEAPVNIFEEYADYRHHSSCDFLSAEFCQKTAGWMQQITAGVRASGLLPISHDKSSRQDRQYSYVATLSGGGFFCLEADFEKRRLSYNIFPSDPQRDAAVHRLLAKAVVRGVVVNRQQVVRPYQQVWMLGSSDAPR